MKVNVGQVGHKNQYWLYCIHNFTSCRSKCLQTSKMADISLICLLKKTQLYH